MAPDVLKRRGTEQRTWVVVVVLAVLFDCGGCNRMWDWSLGSGRDISEVLAGLGEADRMVVKQRSNSEIKIETRDRLKIDEVVRFFQKYPDHWVAFSGAGGDYDVYLYRGERLIGRLGITASSRVRPGEDTLNVENRFRRVRASDVSALANSLKLPWPLP